jgi:hypothetical protein
VVAEFLKMPHFLDDHRVAEVQIRSGRIKAHLDAQGRSPGYFSAQLAFIDKFGATAPYMGNLGVNIALHGSLLCEVAFSAAPRWQRTPLKSIRKAPGLAGLRAVSGGLFSGGAHCQTALFGVSDAKALRITDIRAQSRAAAAGPLRRFAARGQRKNRAFSADDPALRRMFFNAYPS